MNSFVIREPVSKSPGITYQIMEQYKKVELLFYHIKYEELIDNNIIDNISLYEYIVNVIKKYSDDNSESSNCYKRFEEIVLRDITFTFRKEHIHTLTVVIPIIDGNIKVEEYKLYNYFQYKINEPISILSSQNIHQPVSYSIKYIPFFVIKLFKKVKEIFIDIFTTDDSINDKRVSITFCPELSGEVVAYKTSTNGYNGSIYLFTKIDGSAPLVLLTKESINTIKGNFLYIIDIFSKI